MVSAVCAALFADLLEGTLVAATSAYLSTGMSVGALVRALEFVVKSVGSLVVGTGARPAAFVSCAYCLYNAAPLFVSSLAPASSAAVSFVAAFASDAAGVFVAAFASNATGVSVAAFVSDAAGAFASAEAHRTTS